MLHLVQEVPELLVMKQPIPVGVSHPHHLLDFLHGQSLPQNTHHPLEGLGSHVLTPFATVRELPGKHNKNPVTQKLDVCLQGCKVIGLTRIRALIQTNCHRQKQSWQSTRNLQIKFPVEGDLSFWVW